METNSIVLTFINLINWFSWFVSIVAVAMGLYSGALYLTAKGDPAKIASASRGFLYTIIGIVVSVAAFSIKALVKSFIVTG
ncbi:hypothetical protein HY839_04260 [Candidatus Azambacteria bacterium]|nr:hypothetical protein [Candidatus Azambacteria bacterium]